MRAGGMAAVHTARLVAGSVRHIALDKTAKYLKRALPVSERVVMENVQVRARGFVFL